MYSLFNTVCYIAVILVIYLMYVGGMSCDPYDDLMGFWVAPGSFLMESGADNITLYIGGKSDKLMDRLGLGSQKREAYVIIKNNGQLMVNESFDVYIERKLSPGKESTFTFSIDGEIKPFPRVMTLKLNKRFNRMTLSEGDKIYMSLYRDNELTETAYLNLTSWTDNTQKVDDPETETIDQSTDI